MTENHDKQHILDLAFSAPPEERGKILDQECGGDASLRAELEELLVMAAAAEDTSEAPTMAAPESTIIQ